MKRLMKRVLTVLLALVMSIGCLAGTASAATSIANVSIASYDAFRSSVNGKAFDVDGSYGAQCWDGAAILWKKLGGSLLTGNGVARGCWELKRDANCKVNGVTKFTLVTDISDVKRGDVVVLGGTTAGHICFADEDYQGKGTLKIFGQNQNGNSQFTTMTVKTTNFLGAFRYIGWASYRLDVNLTVDGTAYNSGTDFVTFDVTLAGTKVSENGKDYCNSAVKSGSAYTVNDIQVSGCYALNGNASYSGTVNSATTVTIPIVTAHKGYTNAVTTAATCTATGVMTYTCTGCGSTYTESIPATGHNYQAASENGTIIYVCTNCGDSYTTSESVSDWTDTRPEGVPDSQIETATFYRYKDSTETWTQTDSGSIRYASYGDTQKLAWPSGFDTSSSIYTTYNKKPVTASETATTRTTVSNSRIGWIYWHWCYNSYTAGPINRKISNEKTSTYPGFHAFYSTDDVALDTSANARKISKASVCKDTYWWLNERVPIYQCNYTTYTLTSADHWSDWMLSLPEAADGREVESKTMYRVVAAADVIDTDVIAKFTDVAATSWYAPYVRSAIELGFMSGTSDTTFEPYGSTSRAMFVQILYAMAEKPSVNGLSVPFTDVPSGKWYYNAVVWAYNNSVTSGTGADTFSPNANVTREQVAVLLYAYYGRPAVSGDLSAFADANQVDSWAVTALIWATQNGIMNGSAENGSLYLNPLKGATRAETATMMTGFYNLTHL